MSVSASFVFILVTMAPNCHISLEFYRSFLFLHVFLYYTGVILIIMMQIYTTKHSIAFSSAMGLSFCFLARLNQNYSFKICSIHSPGTASFRITVDTKQCHQIIKIVWCRNYFQRCELCVNKYSMIIDRYIFYIIWFVVSTNILF